MKWAKSYTTLPIPSIRGYDYDGTQPSNSTHRPCIILDRMPGKHITNDDWERMTPEQRLLIVAHIARIKAELSIHRFTRIGSLFYYNNKGYTVDRLISHAVKRYCYLHGEKIWIFSKRPSHRIQLR